PPAGPTRSPSLAVSRARASWVCNRRRHTHDHRSMVPGPEQALCQWSLPRAAALALTAPGLAASFCALARFRERYRAPGRPPLVLGDPDWALLWPAARPRAARARAAAAASSRHGA